MQAPFRVAVSLWYALKLIRQKQVVAVLGMGGFPSGPGSFAAWLLRKPLVLHEQNAILGLTNKIASLFAIRRLEAFPGAFPSSVGAVCTGNPVRARITPDQDNVTVPNNTPNETAGNRPLQPFIDDMATAYSWADLVLCRSGALTVAELANAGKPAILVPYPWHKDQQQLRNGRYLADNGAAIILEQKDMTDQRLAELLLSFINDRSQLITMSKQATSCAYPHATATVARHCREVANV